MHDHKLFGYDFIPVGLAFLLCLGLTACSSTPTETTPQAMPEPEGAPQQSLIEEPMEAEPVPVDVKPDIPDRYVVKKGDTLWDISARFLKSPWLWPEVWHINTQIRNPHLIYPGDVIALYIVEGKPYITLEGEAGLPPQLPEGVETVKLSPQIRVKPLEKAIDTLPREAVAPFLASSRVVTRDELRAAPYVVSSRDQHLIAGANDKIYVRNIKDQQQTNYDVVRPGAPYIDPDTDDILGYEAIDLAESRVLQFGDPASLRITRSQKEVIVGDKLLPREEERLDFNFFPHAPEVPVEGRIISVFNGVSQIGQYNVVVINRGAQQGIEVGQVLAVYQSGIRVYDYDDGRRVVLPDERGGLLMVFRVFDQLSYGLIMLAERPMKVLDTVRNP